MIFCGSFTIFLSCFVMLSCTSVCWRLVVSCLERAEFLALVCDMYLWHCHIPIGILGQVWCLIVSIPDLCPLSYFYCQVQPSWIPILLVIWLRKNDRICSYGPVRPPNWNLFFFTYFSVFDPGFDAFLVCIIVQLIRIRNPFRRTTTNKTYASVQAKPERDTYILYYFKNEHLARL